MADNHVEMLCHQLRQPNLKGLQKDTRTSDRTENGLRLHLRFVRLSGYVGHIFNFKEWLFEFTTLLHI